MSKLCGLSFLFILALSFVAKARETTAFEIRAKAQSEVYKEKVRQSESYQRLYPMCSEAFDLKRLIYVYSSASQVMNLASLNTSEYQNISSSGSGVSSLLNKDLNSEALFVAFEDCGLSGKDRDYFIMSLLTLDISGKLLGASGAIGIYKVSKKVFSMLYKKNPFLTRLLAGTAIGSNIYYLMNSEAAHKDSGSSQKIKVDEQVAAQRYDLTDHKKAVEDLKQSVLVILNNEISDIDIQISKLDSSQDTEVQNLMRRKYNLEIKKQAINL